MLARAGARLERLALYREPLRLDRVRILHVPWLFRLPWFRRFRGYNVCHLILLRHPLAEVSDDLVTHERGHVGQDQDHRVGLWLSDVFGGFARTPHEVEARGAPQRR